MPVEKNGMVNIIFALFEFKNLPREIFGHQLMKSLSLAIVDERFVLRN